MSGGACARTSDWEARPLSPAQWAYAALDAHALVRIYDGLAAELGRDALLALCSRPSPRAAPLAGGGGGRGGGGSGGGEAEVDRVRMWAGVDGVGPSAASGGPAGCGSESGNGNGAAAGSNEGLGVGPGLGQAPAPPKTSSAEGMLGTEMAAADRYAGHGARCSALGGNKTCRKPCDLIRAAEPHRTRQRGWAAAWEARAPFGCADVSHRQYSIRPHVMHPSVRSWAHPRHATVHAEVLRPSALLWPGADALRPAHHCLASGGGGTRLYGRQHSFGVIGHTAGIRRPGVERWGGRQRATDRGHAGSCIGGAGPGMPGWAGVL